MRFNPKGGNIVWSEKCAPLGVDHFKYHHRATVVIKGERVRVTSRASGGSFVELLDLKTGKRLARATRGSE